MKARQQTNACHKCTDKDRKPVLWNKNTSFPSEATINLKQAEQAKNHAGPGLNFGVHSQ